MAKTHLSDLLSITARTSNVDLVLQYLRRKSIATPRGLIFSSWEPFATDGQAALSARAMNVPACCITLRTTCFQKSSARNRKAARNSARRGLSLKGLA